MESIQDMAVEVVICAAAFRHGRPGPTESPTSVVDLCDDLCDAVVDRPDWQTAKDLTQQALVVARIPASDADLHARYQADVDAGLIGFGAAWDSFSPLPSC